MTTDNKQHATDNLQLTMPIKILRIMRGLPIGGLERRTLDLLEALNHSGEFDCRIVTILEKGELYASAPARGIAVAHVPIRHRSDWRGLMALRRFIAEGGFHVAHTQSFYPNVPGRVAARLAGAPVIIAQHHNLFSEKCRRWKHKFYERQLARWTDRILCVSEAVRDDYLETTGVSLAKVEVIHNGIDIAPFEQPHDLTALRAELGLDSAARVIALVARLTPAKDPLTFVEAAALIARDVPEAVFLIVGDGKPEYRAKIERAIAGHGLQERIRLTGFRRDIPAIMQLCEAGVLCSRFEGLPGVVLEFFAAARPLIVTDVPGPREIVTSEHNALVIPPGDPGALARAMLRLLRDDVLCTRLASAAHRRAADFSLDRMVENYARLYRDLMDKKKRA